MDTINEYFAGGIYGFYVLIATVVVFYHVSLYKVYEKAGYPGWMALIPYFNVVPFIKIAHRPKWWLYIYIISTIIIFAVIFLGYPLLYILLLLPLIFGLLLCIDFAKAFDQSAVFGIALLFLPFVFIPILAYGDAQPVTFRERDFEE